MWPKTSLVTYCTLHFGLPYIWKTQGRSYLTLGRQKQFSSCMHLLDSCFNVLVRMLRKLGGTLLFWRQLCCYHLIN